MEHQDWTPVVLKKTYNVDKNDKYIKITEEDDYKKSIPISATNSKLIQQARLSKGMKQIDLAKAINKKVETVQSYESGIATPDLKIMLKIEKVLDH